MFYVSSHTTSHVAVKVPVANMIYVTAVVVAQARPRAGLLRQATREACRSRFATNGVLRSMPGMSRKGTGRPNRYP
jgi:hypothetical protein